MFDANKLKYDTTREGLGPQLMVEAAQPVREWLDGKASDRIIGMRYAVVLPKLAYERLTVVVEGTQKPLELENGEPKPVIFTNLRLKLYAKDSKILVSAKADGVRFEEEPASKQQQPRLP